MELSANHTGDERLASEMKVRFDAEEMHEFFDGFAPLEPPEQLLDLLELAS